jgi:hypothetical protein
LWAHGRVGDANGPNAIHLNADDLLACDQVRSAVGGDVKLQQMGMPCSAGSRPNYQQTARSLHSGMVIVCLGDGSVRQVSDYVDIVGVNGQMSVWDRLNASSDGVVLSHDKF